VLSERWKVVKTAWFGFAKVRYRGLKKNTHRLLVTCALANLFMVRRHLLRCQGA
jgi:IS5 family transposase